MVTYLKKPYKDFEDFNRDLQIFNMNMRVSREAREQARMFNNDCLKSHQSKFIKYVSYRNKYNLLSELDKRVLLFISKKKLTLKNFFEDVIKQGRLAKHL
jgi:hypothetical protein